MGGDVVNVQASSGRSPYILSSAMTSISEDIVNVQVRSPLLGPHTVLSRPQLAKFNCWSGFATLSATMPLAKLKYKQLAESKQPIPAEQHAVREA